jgi:hypothetical protein
VWKNDTSHSELVRDLLITGDKGFVSCGSDTRVIGWESLQ